MTRDIRIADFDYNLPEENIAVHPIAERDACRLLVSPPRGDAFVTSFAELPGLLPADSLLVANNARVINARIKFRKSTGAEIEVFLLEPLAPADYALMFQADYPVKWKCLIGNAKRWKSGDLTKEIIIDGRKVILTASREAAHADDSVTLSWDTPEFSFAEIVWAAGFIPIPPYLNRESESSDESDYQTVYSAVNGSVAAPTAGLHFTPGLFERLEQKGILTGFVTLHVGAGTFRPVKSETIGEHDMHSEVFTVSRELLVTLCDRIQEGLPVVAVGTTTVRTLESLPYFGRMALRKQPVEHLGQWEAYNDHLDDTPVTILIRALIDLIDSCKMDAFTARTSIMIAPGFRWRIVDAMITNFHQPQSTLLLLVASFLEQDNPKPFLWKKLYEKALESSLRFLSYGDACLLFPKNKNLKTPIS